jgi:Mechanosensitive ion channel, conserved TM helix
MWTEIQRALDESTTQVMTGLARLLPGVAAMIVAVLIAVLIGWLVGSIVRRALLGVDFDRRVTSWGWPDISVWSVSKSPSMFASRLVSWTIIGLGVLIGIAAFDSTLTSRLVMRVFDLLPNLVMAGLLFLVGSVLARFLSRGVLIGAVNMNLQYARLLSVGVRWLVLVLAGAMALDHVGIGGNIVSLAFAILFGGIVLALALAVGLGSKELVARSLERESLKAPEDAEPPSTFRHL